MKVLSVAFFTYLRYILVFDLTAKARSAQRKMSAGFIAKNFAFFASLRFIPVFDLVTKVRSAQRTMSAGFNAGNFNYLRSLLSRCLFVFLLFPGFAVANDVIHHDITVVLSPDTHSIKVEDTLTLPETLVKKGVLQLYLHAGLSPELDDSSIKLNLQPVDDSGQSHVPLELLSLSLPKNKSKLTLRYSGEIHHPVEQLGAEYARSFGVSPGIISPDGVFLSGASYWYPHSGEALHTFNVSVELPKTWSSVSQGQRIKDMSRNDVRLETWSIDKPQDEIYLIAAQFREYNQASAAVEAMVFLRQADDSLAQKYLETTAQYIEMYRKLLGPYPYKKFALVENFWETGYGMPSFTLLGPKVIRFPFILHSSYPHEILHNWWGNGVFVDYEKGNWAEGLTSYLADHLIKEQRGRAVNYRRNALQKYTDFVNGNRDFPLTEFRSRHSATTEAVGYGKTLMFFHMLRLQTGDEQFIRALQTFYRKYKFKYAAFEDVQHVFEQVTDTELADMFSQWVSRTGAPELRISNAKARPENGNFVLTADIEQIQEGKPYSLRLPLSVSIEGKDRAFQAVEIVKSKHHKLHIKLEGRPLQLDIDPEFDVFRRLHRNEIPPAFTKAFGAEKVLIVLPAKANSKIKKAYEDLANNWKKGQQGKVVITFDDQLQSLPDDRAIWLLGWENRYRETIQEALKDYKLDFADDALTIGTAELSREKHSLVLTARNPANPEHAISWISNENERAMPGLGRKLPHYGRYSYLGFEGDEPTNIVKGQWPVVKSPMSIPVVQADGKITGPRTVQRAPRVALAQLPAVFSEKRMLKDIEVLASDKMAGRGLGTSALDDAANYIAGEFKKAGLQPGGDGNSYFQSWSENAGLPTGKTQLKNIIGILPGKKAQWREQSVVVAAHYDHLGRGWPDVHQGDEGKIHYGADDNASGVAVMLELIRNIASKGSPDRTIVFVAFTAEEAGRLGAIHFVNNASRYPVNKMMGMLNLDTVGRLNNNKLTVFGTGSAREWIHIFRGAGFVTGVDIQSVKNEFGSSDQRSFLDAGVPAVQFFSGANSDFHRPADTPDKIDSAGLVKVATVLKEAVMYLAARAEPLHSTLTMTGTDQKKAAGTQKSTKGRRVSLGTVPDFAFNEKGVRITDVTRGSPAEKSGLRSGDVIIRLNATDVADLKDFSAVLRSLNPGDPLTIVYRREGKKVSVTTHVIAR